MFYRAYLRRRRCQDNEKLMAALSKIITIFSRRGGRAGPVRDRLELSSRSDLIRSSFYGGAEAPRGAAERRGALKRTARPSPPPPISCRTRTYAHLVPMVTALIFFGSHFQNRKIFFWCGQWRALKFILEGVSS